MAVDLREQLQHSLGEAYRIERELGGGGMSRVFLAVETSLQRRVVVKVLLPELAAGVSVERFRREIHLAAQLQHPHIVPLLSAGESVGLPYFTMPYVDGESLRARLVRERELPVPQAVRVLRDVASALAYAHTQGVVHRDIKPDNVLLSHGVAVVTDFGVAKALTVSAGPDSPSRTPGLTELGITLGTPTYMAPEQGVADPAMDHRVDIYAFGVTAYEILTGEPPFTGPSPQAVLSGHIAGLPAPVASRRPGLPPLLGHLVMKCLEKRPSDRPQTADDIISTLDMLTTPSGTVPVIAQPSGPGAWWKRAGLSGARRFGPPAAAALLVAAVALLAWPQRAETPAVPPATPPATSPAAAPVPAPAAAPAPSVAETAETAEPAAARARVQRPLRVERPEPAEPAPSAEDSALLARLEQEADGARARALAAGAGESLIARGDSSVARAESLAAPPPRAVSPAPAPAPTRDSAPPPAPDPAQQIRGLFAEYGAAIEARSVEAIRRTYPGLSAERAREWEDFFRGVTDIRVELSVGGLKVAGDAAEAELAGVYVFNNPSTHRTQRENVAFQASLRREGNRWRIASLR